MVLSAVAVVLSCAPQTHPVLDLTLSRKTVVDATPLQVKVAGTNAAGKAGTGTVKITSEAGSLADGVEVQLDNYGTAKAELICDPLSQPACVESVRVTATWTSDKEVVVAQAAFTVSSTGAGGGNGGGSGSGGGGGSLITDPHRLEELPGPRLWSDGLRTFAAVDTQDRLFVSDGNAVFIGNGVPSVYLTRDEIKTAAGVINDDSKIVDLDVASDDQLYMIIAGSFGEPNSILVASAPHAVTKKFSVGNVGFLFNFSAVTPERFVVAGGYNGIYEVTSAGTSLLYDNTVIGVSTCVSPRLIGLSSYFLYSPGCTSTPLVGGRLDGLGASIVYTPGVRTMSGMGRAPRDSIVINEESRITYFSVLDGGSREIVTVPDIPTYANQVGLGPSRFYGFDVVVGPGNKFYFVGGTKIYVAR